MTKKRIFLTTLILVTVLLISVLLYFGPKRTERFSIDTAECRKAVFFVPHQDDETLFFSQVIFSAIKAFGPENVTICLISDGSGSNARQNENIKQVIDNILDTTEELSGISFDENTREEASALIFSRMRTNEFNASMHSMGINEIFYWNLPDSKLPENVDIMVSRMKEIIALKGRDCMYFTYSPYYDPHSDHCAVGKALMSIYEKDPSLDGKVFFIIKNEEDVEADFLNSEYYQGNAFLLKDRRSYSSIKAAVAEYKYAAVPEINKIARELAVLIGDSGQKEVKKAIRSSETISSLRLAIGPNYSVQGMFENLDKNLKWGTLHTLLHKPFEMDE